MRISSSAVLFAIMLGMVMMGSQADTDDKCYMSCMQACVIAAPSNPIGFKICSEDCHHKCGPSSTMFYSSAMAQGDLDVPAGNSVQGSSAETTYTKFCQMGCEISNCNADKIFAAVMTSTNIMNDPDHKSKVEAAINEGVEACQNTCRENCGRKV